MPTFKNIRIKKRGGGTRTQRVQVLRSGKYKFVKNKGGASRTKTTKRKTTKRKRSYMARRKKKSRKSRSFTIPIALTVGATYGILAPGPGKTDSVLDLAMKGKFTTAFRLLGKYYLGIGPSGFDIKNLQHGTVPLMLGIIIHKIASKLGVNRKLGQAGVPIIRI